MSVARHFFSWRDFFYLVRLFSLGATFLNLARLFLFGATFSVWRDFFYLARLFLFGVIFLSGVSFMPETGYGPYVSLIIV